jgi:hypothetical protein
MLRSSHLRERVADFTVTIGKGCVDSIRTVLPLEGEDIQYKQLAHLCMRKLQ